MTDVETAEVMRQFNKAFVEHSPQLLQDLVADDCVMEAIEPAPDGARYEGRDACLGFWEALADDSSTQFEPEDFFVAGDRAIIRWSYRFGDGDTDYVRGVTLMRVRDRVIVEALGYSKTPGSDSSPLAEMREH